MVNMSPKIDDSISVLKYPSLNFIAQATGITIREDIISIPTVLAETEIVIAISIIKIVFTKPTFIPDSLALVSSNEMCIKSL